MMDDVQYPSHGIRTWKNRKNRFAIFELHYTADEAKRGDSWKEEAKAGMPIRQWQQEYELNWNTFEGLPVYGDWNERVHAVKEEMSPKIGLPLLIGYDFGLTPAAVIGQLEEDRLFIFKEFIGFNIGAEKFSARVVSECRILYPEWPNLKRDWLCFIDPSGAFRKDTDEGTCARVLDSAGYKCISGPIAFEARKQGVENFMTKMTKRGPCFQISSTGCPVLVEGFKGGYMYPEKSSEVEPNLLRPIKNSYSHPHDALQYLACGIKTVSRSIKASIPKPSFAWMNDVKRRR